MSDHALNATYVKTRSELEEYFDRTAAAAWARLKAAMEQGHAIGAGRLDRDAAHERRAAVS